MPYAPTVNDISGQILAEGRLQAAQAKAQGILGSAQAKAQGITGAANLRLQGTQALAGGIGSAGSSIAGGLLKLGQTFESNRAILNNSFGKIDALSQLAPNLMTPEVMDHISSLKDPQKIAAAVAVYEDFYNRQQAVSQAKNIAVAQEEVSQAYSKTGAMYPTAIPGVNVLQTGKNQGQVIDTRPDQVKWQSFNTLQGVMERNPITGQVRAVMDPDNPKERLMPMQNDPYGLNAPPGAPVSQGGTLPGTPAAPATPQRVPNARQIAALKANPKLAPDFDAYFGPGAAQRVLNGP